MTAQHPIDAVITWVDGDDPQHKQKLNRYLASIGRQPKSADSTRFRSLGEIDYCVASIIQYAPFIHRIFIITDEQTPSLVERYKGTDWEERIAIVDHKTVFRGYESVLPTFNSLSIETVLFRIPALSEYFIYFNDDVFLLKEVRESDFFRRGKPYLRGCFKRQSAHRLSKKIRKWLGFKQDAENPGFKFSLERSAQMLGEHDTFFRIDHTPHPMRKSTFLEASRRLPNWLSTNVKFPLRSGKQVSSVSLMNHLELKSGAEVTIDTDVLNLKPKRYSPERLRKVLDANNTKFGCIQSLDQAGEKQQQIVLDWLDKKISNLT
ncbi:MAG: stealth family protein [Idiomarina sp.]|nr:stealth family protein [Idiomarina sp.]